MVLLGKPVVIVERLLRLIEAVAVSGIDLAQVRTQSFIHLRSGTVPQTAIIVANDHILREIRAAATLGTVNEETTMTIAKLPDRLHHVIRQPERNMIEEVDHKRSIVMLLDGVVAVEEEEAVIDMTIVILRHLLLLSRNAVGVVTDTTKTDMAIAEMILENLRQDGDLAKRSQGLKVDGVADPIIINYPINKQESVMMIIRDVIEIKGIGFRGVAAMIMKIVEVHPREGVPLRWERRHHAAVVIAVQCSRTSVVNSEMLDVVAVAVVIVIDMMDLHSRIVVVSSAVVPLTVVAAEAIAVDVAAVVIVVVRIEVSARIAKWTTADQWVAAVGATNRSPRRLADHCLARDHATAETVPGEEAAHHR